MTPPARIQAAIEILDRVIASARDNGPAADAIVADWFRTHRFAGSGDKRAIRDHVYGALRAFGERPESGRAAMLTLLAGDHALFDGSLYGPAPVAGDETGAIFGLLPAWLADLIPSAEHPALLKRAPMDLRVNRLKAYTVEIAGAVPIPGLPDGLRLAEPMAIEQHPAWLAGQVEVQDAGSQWILEACAARPGMTIVDFCAGAGGKTLALASHLAGTGRLIATDTDRGRLSRLPLRAQRAGADVETRLLNPRREHEALGDLLGEAGLVLVDAPCSGSGTWRRNPEGRWRLTPARLDRVIAQQAAILDAASPLVRPGGVLVYAVCSLIAGEGRDQIDAFLARNDGWSADPLALPVGLPDGAGIRLTPARDSTDGFFFARLSKPC